MHANFQNYEYFAFSGRNKISKIVMKPISFWYKLIVLVDFFKNGINPAATVVKKWLWQVRKIFTFCIFAIPQYRENAASEKVWQFVSFQCPEKSGWWKNSKNHIHEVIIFLVVFLFFKRDSYIFFCFEEHLEIGNWARCSNWLFLTRTENFVMNSW